MKYGRILTPWVDPRLEIRSSCIAGKGLIVREPLRAGEIVIRWGGTIFTRAEILAGKANQETVAILDENLYLADPLDAVLFEEYPLNHSCDPNLWMLDALTLVTRHPVASGQELTADYALWLYEQNWSLERCCCGSSLCRGKVTDQDWMLPELQARYAGHFTPHINRCIKKSNCPTSISRP